MGESANLKPKPRRKLSRSQITEILERNASLYKNEEAFIHYIVELALYLVEYEYDWAESGAQPPAFPAAHDNSTPSNPAASSPRILAVQQCARALKPAKRECPYCGNMVGDALVCPSCKNLTR
jgi:hypothetical protein